LKKNYRKSLDHKSFQYKDFMKKYMNKQNHLARIKLIADRSHNNRLFNAHKMCVMHGAGEKSPHYDFYYFNTFGKDFGGPFD